MRNAVRIAGRDVLFVMAAEAEYGPHLKRLFTPVMTGVGPVEAGVRLSAELSWLKSEKALPDLVVSSRSKEQEEGGPITKTVSPMGALLLRDRFPLTPPHPSPLVTCGVKSSTLVIPPALFQKTAILATHSFSWSLRHKP